MTVFLVDASAPGRAPAIQMGNYVTGIGNKKGMMDGPLDIFQSMHDTEDPDQKPLSHLKRMSRFMIALVVQHGRFTFDRVVITTVKRAEPSPPGRDARRRQR